MLGAVLAQRIKQTIFVFLIESSVVEQALSWGCGDLVV